MTLSKLLFSIFLTASNFIFSFSQSPVDVVPDSLNFPSNKSSSNHFQVSYIDLDSQNSYIFYWTKLDYPSQLSLHSNLQTPVSSLELYQRNHCDILINGGFYNKSQTHIGWFFSDSFQLSTPETNSLFNGFFYFDKFEKPFITTSPPSDPVIFGLQAGPILILNSQPSVLKLSSDQSEKRSLVAIDNNQQVIFVYVTSPNNTSGPKLQQLPLLVDLFSKSENLFLLFAINLDGGTASAFITPSIKFTEINHLGSFFCIQSLP